MTTCKENLIFKSLLYALYWLIRLTALRSRQLRSKLMERDITVVMGSKDGAIARTLRCTGGKIRSRKGQAEDAVSKITWASPAAGSRVMLRMVSGDSKALVKAVMKGDLLPQGDAAGVRWFLDVVTLLTKTYIKKKGPKPEN